MWKLLVLGLPTAEEESREGEAHGGFVKGACGGGCVALIEVAIVTVRNGWGSGAGHAGLVTRPRYVAVSPRSSEGCFTGYVSGGVLEDL